MIEKLNILTHIGITLYLCTNSYTLGYFRDEYRNYSLIKQIGIILFCFFFLNIFILLIATYNSITNLFSYIDNNYLQIRFWCLYFFTDRLKSEMDESKLKAIDRKCLKLKPSNWIWDVYYIYCANLIFKLNDFKPTYLTAE